MTGLYANYNFVMERYCYVRWERSNLKRLVSLMIFRKNFGPRKFHFTMYLDDDDPVDW